MSARYDPPVFSVIICTRNRQAALGACIRSVLAAARRVDPRSVELVVVDNGSVDETAAQVTALARSSQIIVRFLAEPRPGLSYARNAGMAAACGRYFVFTDDDCQMDPDYFLDLLRHYARGDQETIRGGRVELGDPLDAPLTVRTGTESALYHPKHPPGGFIQGCNMVVPRQTARRIGKFDVRLGAGSRLHAAEDADYIIRAHRLGITVAYVPDMQVRHFHGRRSDEDVRQISRNYHIGNGALYAKHALSAPWVMIHFFWCLRGALRELAGGPRFDAAHGISHWSVFSQNLRGMVGFLTGGLSAARSAATVTVLGILQLAE
ncbi:MAG: glycosyltransferase family 2 protein [Hyphomonas sp.]